MWLTGCAKIPPGRSAIDHVDVRGASALDSNEVADKLATAPSGKFLGLFRGVVYDYEIFDPPVLQRDLARVERFYRGKGFLDAHARVGRVDEVGPEHVRVEIVVDEGPPTLNRSVRIAWDGAAPPLMVPLANLEASLALPAGERFDEEAYARAKDTVKKVLTDSGYAYATVTSDAALDPGAHVADYVLTIRAGPLARFGKISIVGLDPDGSGPRPQEIDEAPLRRAIAIDEGSPYSTKEIDSATQALLDLEVFSAVQIDPQLPEPPPADPVVPLVVRVEPTRLRQVRMGGGLEFDEIKTDWHVLAGWEDHNFLGGLRDFSVDFRPGVVLYPLRIGYIVPPTNWLVEERLRLQFRQPAFLEPRTSAFVKPELNAYPFLVQANPPPNQPVLGYVEGKGAIGVDRPFGKLFVSLAYNVQVEDPFKYTASADATPKPIVLSYPQLVTTLDLRDDPLHPHKGIFLSNDVQVAGGVFGGSASDFRVQPEARAYLPIARHVTFASRASIGLLFASNYSIANYLPNQNTGDPNRVSDIETVYFRGFSLGGPNSNRGFPVRGIAPYGTVPFLLPATASTQVATNCIPGTPTYNEVYCALPIAGFTLWQWSNEVRFDISGPFSSAVFCDMGDVSPNQAEFRFKHLHLSCGVGARYDTPVGPIRLDVGYRIQPLQVIGYSDETAAANANPVNGAPAQLFGHVPIAIAFGIGEAY